MLEKKLRKTEKPWR